MAMHARALGHCIQIFIQQHQALFLIDVCGCAGRHEAMSSQHEFECRVPVGF